MTAITRRVAANGVELDVVEAGRRATIVDGAGHGTRQERPDAFTAALLDLLNRPG